MNSNLGESCYTTVSQIVAEAESLSYRGNLTHENIGLLVQICYRLSQLEIDTKVKSKYGKPMVWIGIYIAVASLFCVLAMTSDLLDGFRNRKFWFPSKYFTLNATSITVITIAMKLPVDLNTPGSYGIDLLARLGSLVFMSTMITNLMPSLASMGNKELLANATGLVILVITLIVNTLIGFTTGLLPSFVPEIWLWLCVLLCLLMLFISMVISIPTIKNILEFKYQVAHRVASNDISQVTRSNVKELKQHLRRYWVMARTSNPQFVMASTPLCCAAAIISISTAVLYLIYFSFIINGYYKFYFSDYKWSMVAIFITQGIGIAVGNIAPLLRCFSALDFKVSIKWTISHLKVLRIENYWTLKLSIWKESHLPFPSSGRLLKAFVHNLKNLILWLCIGFQKVIVVTCKVIGLIQIIIILLMYSLIHVKSLKEKFFGVHIAKTRHDMVGEPSLNDTHEDFQNYVVQLQDETQRLAERSLKRISNSLNHLMQKVEKKHLPKSLIRFQQKSTGFEGVENFDSEQIISLPSVDVIRCWSLPLITLTCIAIALPDVGKEVVDCLINSVGEGLSYTLLVDENLKYSHDTINIKKLINNLWDEVEVNFRWLEYTLKGNAYKGKTSKELVIFFNDKAKEVVENLSNTNEAAMENSYHKLIAANSMYRITQAIMHNKRSAIEENSSHQVFDMLSCMIADILVACLTNLPQIIAMKCYESVIEKREDSVEEAAELLGRSKEIIEYVQTRELPNMDPKNMMSIEEWRNYLNALP